MIIIKKPKNKVNEDDIQNADGGSNANQEVDVQKQQAENQRSIQVNRQIVELMNKKLNKKTQYQNTTSTYQQEVRDIETQLVQLAKQKADLGEDVDINMVESVKLSRKFWKKLYEATSGNSRTEDLYVIIRLSFSQIENLSFTPSDTWCKTKARNITTYIYSNFDDINSKTYHDTDAFLDFVEKSINDGFVSLSMRERDAFMRNFEDNLSKSPMLGYIINNSK